MSRNRQDGWTKDEDVILANIVLEYIRTGKTQLEAFKEVAKQLSRTAAACGFRWNATVRKRYEEDINEAKQERKQFMANNQKQVEEENIPKVNTVDMAISLLEQMKEQIDTNIVRDEEYDEETISQLKAENEQLKKMLKLYHDGWTEMNKVWEWIRKQHSNDLLSK